MEANTADLSKKEMDKHHHQQQHYPLSMNTGEDGTVNNVDHNLVEPNGGGGTSHQKPHGRQQGSKNKAKTPHHNHEGEHKLLGEWYACNVVQDASLHGVERRRYH